ncbi:MAG TPA: SUMF1/EgtB/PvdO family nonheme iron enzyme [Gammaproteobacteria bacterium]|nr:SUMF1/EgtB/PvdO family nonheme iron enzyme [Gammaproteobacteria bacterium]
MTESDREFALDRLAELQRQTLSLLAGHDDTTCRRQHHPELSPLSWHVGHCAFVETHWLRERVRGEAVLGAPHHTLYLPENTPKTRRPAGLPPRADLAGWVETLQAENRRAWREVLADGAHPLLRDDYLLRFVIQHYCQHLETLRMLLRRLIPADAAPPARVEAAASTPDARLVEVPGGPCRVGTENDPGAYDNELPPRELQLPCFAIAARPVSNAEYLAFVRDGGYREPRLWTGEGWEWLRRTAVSAPEHWVRDGDAGWLLADADGLHAFDPGAPVDGLSLHEARAFARWAGCRLPHEYEWEAACRAGLLRDMGRVWEWCDNTFHPYPGFHAFPYDGYSMPWFDGTHYVLRGGSRHTEPEIRRPGFRNFYQADQRHMFAGLRLARDAG